ncbi:MAG: translation initiation factor IF-2 [Phycisphaerae bacterium]
MAEKKRRIHHLAKELEVKSKTIIEKCAAEGIEIKNHMHVVSAGLEATIREWFSEGAHKTTLEESDRIDLKRVRVKKKKKKVSVATKVETSSIAGEASAEPALAGASGSGESATAILEPPSDTEETTQLGLDTTLPSDDTTVAATVASSTDATDATADIEAKAAPTVEPSVEEKAEPESDATTEEPIESPPAPVGPQNIPEPAKLSGPKFVRMDRPERVERPRPAARAPSRPARPKPEGPPLPEGDATKEGRRGEGHKSRVGTGAGGDPTAKRPHPRRGGLRDNRQASSEQLREWRERDLEEMRDRLAQASGRGIGGLRAVERQSSGRRGGMAPVRIKKDKIELTEPILIKDLSRESGIPVLTIVRKIQDEQGIMLGINSRIDTDQAQLIAAEFGIELIVSKAKTGLDILAEEFEAIERKNPVPRPPVVTVLGHVDHGKTSLLDRIRKANVVNGEAGGITQHVGAYRVKVGDGWVSFLDTPGHAAFTAMRARGANMTDVVVLVVAADDGVMPTTIEAINHAKAADATIVIALNKIDLDHDLNKIYGQLAEQGLTPSGDWGGDIDVIKTSAITGEGIDELLTHLATLSDVMDLKADPNISATGTVIEAERNDRVGNLARVLVQEGTLRTGQILVCGATHGRVRSMKDDTGRTVKTAGPSTPVEITGLNGAPQAGDKFYTLKNAKRAKEIAEEIAMIRRDEDLVRVAKPTSLESMFAQAAAGEIPELNVIIRADVDGSIDALQTQLASFPDDEVKLNIMHSGVGSVTESDLVLAEASQAIIIAFGIVPDPAIQKRAELLGVDIRTYRIIYNVSDDIKKALEGLLTPDEIIESRGRAEVREIFYISKVGKVAGCFVRDGVFNRSHQVRVLRDNVIVLESAGIDSLRRFKDDAKEVKSGLECGIKIDGFDDVKPGDVIESFEVIKIARTLKDVN